MKNRKARGMIYLFVGCLLLLCAGGWSVSNFLEDQNAGKEASAILEQLDIAQKEMIQQEETSTEEESSAQMVVVDGEAFCGRVMIDALGIELPVYDVWDYSRLKKAPCRYMGSVATNDIIIAAHNYKTHFGLLHQLEKGNEIRFIDITGKTHLYEVCEIVVLDGTAVTDMQAGNWDFTLFTCTKGGKQRVTIRCERILE
jgi:sortase A